ncbi:hypothetical protein BV898_02226 [Hypsibius exemplaris]|uniref:Uncharacterized protein n=1 Tax=Hypsibius exemplaris TaxID=2072580 RepID=A0A1W0X8M8_HYPEX|nr:hypothetical protein BV898_02226 [Hypsibius exemplaris]
MTGTAARKSTSSNPHFADLGSDLPERDYIAALESVTAEAILLAWEDHKAQRSSTPRNPESDCIGKVRNIIATMYTSELKARRDKRMIVQADVLGHSIIGRAPDQVITTFATRTLVHVPRTRGKSLGSLGDSTIVFSNGGGHVDDVDEDEDGDGDGDDDPLDEFGEDVEEENEGYIPPQGHADDEIVYPASP